MSGTISTPALPCKRYTQRDTTDIFCLFSSHNNILHNNLTLLIILQRHCIICDRLFFKIANADLLSQSRSSRNWLGLL